jgi:hypothetical protein
MPHYSLHEAVTPAGRSTTMSTGTFLPPEVAPFINPKGNANVHYLAVLISGHHGPVVFVFGDGPEVDADLACLLLPIINFKAFFSLFLVLGHFRAGIFGGVIYSSALDLKPATLNLRSAQVRQ